ncbi:hypothetical protein [Dactylosporangium sp. CA-233914]
MPAMVPMFGIVAGIPVLLIVLGINMLADVLRDRLDPHGRLG